MFVTTATATATAIITETYKMDGQWRWNHDIKLAKWQHHAMSSRAGFA